MPGSGQLDRRSFLCFDGIQALQRVQVARVVGVKHGKTIEQPQLLIALAERVLRGHIDLKNLFQLF
eukprot:8212152-Pyramimonas_sp.AAC.1